MEISLGQVVYSKAGRDTGKRFVIVGFADSEHVLIANGDLRRVEKPKKKKIKHLVYDNEVLSPINDKLCNKQRISNSELRKLLNSEPTESN